MVIHLQTSHGQDSSVTVTLPFLWPSADVMKEVTDALLIMVLVLKFVMSSLLYIVSTNIYFMIHCDLEWIMVSPVKAVNMSSDGHLFLLYERHTFAVLNELNRVNCKLLT